MSRDLDYLREPPAIRRHVAGAFTLTEIVAVLTIISVAAAIAAPRYSGAVSRYRSRLAAQRLAADLDWARAHARATSSEVAIDFAGTGYTIEALAALDDDGVYRVDLAQPPYRVAVKHSVTLPQRLTFNAYGVPNGSGIILVQSGQHGHTVVIDATSNVARVE